MRFSRDSWIVLGVLAAITVAYVLVVYRWQASKLTAVRTRIAAQEREIEAAVARAGRVPPMLREIKAMKQRYNKDWYRRLPQQQELAGFLRDISGGLAQESLSNVMIAPGDPTRGPLYNVLPITMTFEGSFLGLARFLKSVDGMARLTRIDQLSITPQRQSEDMSVVLGMNIYFTEQ